LKLKKSFHSQLKEEQEVELAGVLGCGSLGAVYEAKVVNTSNDSDATGASLRDAAAPASPAAAAASSIARLAVKVFDSLQRKAAKRESFVMEWLIGKPQYVQLLGYGMLPPHPAAPPWDAGTPAAAAAKGYLPFIVMELCDASLEGPKKHTEAEARMYVQQVLQAAAELHQGVRHHSNGKVAIIRHR
jgi:serine/threonine protein kinase